MQAQKKPPYGSLISLKNAKAGLEHRNYPYDLKRVKLIMLSMIPSVPIGDNRTVL
ncbi:hypothetical protein TUM12151_25910 [Morganella morganii]|nr:hypothetical protein TUM12149_27990 [Morganella morganii]GIZ31633.1 hypothetical protein TUM12150_21190 [Morganella morganii]GIZ35605.1 hypothetical protein TUM12151_25910 [Morganella morganii]